MRIIKSSIVQLNTNEILFELPVDAEILDFYIHKSSEVLRNLSEKFYKNDVVYFEVSFITEKDKKYSYTTKEYKIFYNNDLIPTNSLYIKSFSKPFVFHLFEIINKFEMPIARPA